MNGTPTSRAMPFQNFSLVFEERLLSSELGMPAPSRVVIDESEVDSHFVLPYSVSPSRPEGVQGFTHQITRGSGDLSPGN